MKKTVLCAAALCAVASSSWAQSSVTIYGIVDVALRSEDNGPNGTRLSAVAPGGMSQSRLGFRLNEDLGGGMAALANFEHRFNADTGTASAADFWRQSWVGLKTSYGQVMLGRQYNVLFDVTTSTYASFKYSPYIEAFKPEIGMSLGARTSNSVKYLFEMGGFRGALAASAGEGTGAGSSRGGYLRYENGPFAVGAGMQINRDAKWNEVTATTFGGSYTWGKLQVLAGWAKTDPDDKFDRATLAALLANGGTNGAFGVSAALDSRTMWMAGALYQLTPQLNLGVHYWDAKQDSNAGTGGAADGTAKFAALVADYALSKRTDVYFEADKTALGKKQIFANGETSRTGYMVGVRHRF